MAAVKELVAAVKELVAAVINTGKTHQPGPELHIVLFISLELVLNMRRLYASVL